jgi:ribosomal protein L12E/L44/L45/RPP1/RPP2
MTQTANTDWQIVRVRPSVHRKLREVAAKRGSRVIGDVVEELLQKADGVPVSPEQRLKELAAQIDDAVDELVQAKADAVPTAAPAAPAPTE